MYIWIFLTPPASTVLIITEYPLHPISPFFGSVARAILGRALSCTMASENMVLFILLGTITRSDLRVYALVCITINIKPITQRFEVMGSLVSSL